MDEPGQLGLHPTQQPKTLVVLALGHLTQSRISALGPVEAVHAEVVLPVRTADFLTCTTDDRLDLYGIIPGALREFRNAGEQTFRSGELTMRTDRLGEILQHGGIAVPKVAHRMLGGLGERRLGGRIEVGAVGDVQILDELGHVLRTLAQCESGVQFTQELFDGGRRHALHPVTTSSRPPLVIRVLQPEAERIPAIMGAVENADSGEGKGRHHPLWTVPAVRHGTGLLNFDRRPR
ncbi:hypothetical protein ABZ461_37685 [Actinacidiphila glaucinigra]|uniref:hypothetical protein n=1 Tax=Actinacidiphila glaucinigra TaxID=235986 RepID=UPI0033CF2B09